MPRKPSGPMTPLGQLEEMIGIVKKETGQRQVERELRVGSLGPFPMTRPAVRRFNVTIMFTTEALEKLDALCLNYGTKRSEIVNRLIDSAFDNKTESEE